MPLLLPNQQRQSTEGTYMLLQAYKNTVYLLYADETSEQRFLDGRTLESIVPCTSVHDLSAVSSLSHRFNTDTFTSPSTKVGIH